MATSGNIVDGGCALGAELVGAGVPGHDGGVGMDVRGGEVRAASLGVLLEEVGDVRVESQHGYRRVEAPGDESCACLRRDVR